MVNTEFYKNAKIYKIVDNTNGNIYIGSTCKTLCWRIAQYRASYKCFLNGKFSYITSFKILENGDYDIILIEEVKDCENKEQLKARERFYIESLECVNKVIVGRSKKEYKEDNKDQIKTYQKLYWKQNEAEIKEYKNQICICDLCNCNYTKSNKSNHEKSQKHQDNLLN